MRHLFILLLLPFSLLSQNAQVDTSIIQQHYTAGVDYFYKGAYQSAINEWQQELRLKKKKYGSDHLSTAKTYYNIGAAYSHWKQHAQATHYMSIALDVRIAHISQQGDNDPQLKSNTIANCYILMQEHINLGDFHKTNLIAKDVIDRLNLSVRDAPLIWQCRSQALFHQGNQLDTALALCQQAVTTLSKGTTREDTIYHAQSLYDKGNILDKMGVWKKAEQAYLQSYDILYNDIQELSQDLINVSLNLGDLYTKMEQWEDAEKWLKEAEVFAVDFNDGERTGNNLAYALINLGELYQKTKSDTAALAQIDEALAIWIKGWENNYTIPSDQNLNGLYFDILQSLELRGEVLLSMGQKEMALHNYQQIDRLISRMRQRVSTHASQLHWIKNTRKIYYDAVTLAHSMGKDSMAFQFMEQSKAVLLYEHLQQIIYSDFNQLPDSIVFMRAQILDEIKICENQYRTTAKQSDSLANRIDLLYSNLNAWDEKYLSASTTKTVPNNEINVLPKYQQYLQEEQAESVIFFEYNGGLFAAYMNANEFIIHHYNNINNTHWHQLNTWLDHTLHPNSSQSQADMQDYLQTSHQLYQTFLADLPIGQTDHIIIIPDGPLQFIPFSVWLTDAPEPSSHFKDAPYLIQQQTISYAYSASVQLTMYQMERNPQNDALIIAPGAYKDLPPLQPTEAIAIHQIIQGQLLKQEEAYTENVLQQLPQKSLIHISSHASTREEETANPWIAFTDRKLYLSEIHNLDISADLVVLSACETSKGRQIEGEGVLSLARGLSFAGVPEVVSSLWSVNESSTTFIMKQFYQALKKNQAPSEALRNAQLTYLQQSELGASHPYYWAAFSVVGHDHYSYTSPMYSYIILGIILSAIFVFVGYTVGNMWNK